MKTWYCADLHLNHHNIIKYCNRPWSSVEEMNGALISIWNERVKSLDQVIFLGDFGYFRTTEGVTRYLKMLNGSKILIAGNHDDKVIRQSPEWKAIYDIYESCDLFDDGAGRREYIRFCCCHYPMRSWNKLSKGCYMLHGHCHGTIQPIDHSFDVGVDSPWTKYGPVDIHDIVKHQFDVFGVHGT
jgi:calcineurin-like phosphoesterase family protein